MSGHAGEEARQAPDSEDTSNARGSGARAAMADRDLALQLLPDEASGLRVGHAANVGEVRR